ncbi:hypothetical protein OG599_02395 [Streptomyces sp. NBC_01335]|uniref:hypothetical protein n=1 Tax=Streptomyces sp. NBC_01335 TaxID=2903828 RepID=UPI002E130658|nr:hypothetical protein OG599_02395 [Streptomyces sp. NBC_01335]
MNLDAELSALAAQEDLPSDLVWRLLRHPAARRSMALRRRDLTERLIEEIIKLGSARSLAANTSVPADVSNAQDLWIGLGLERERAYLPE